MIPRPMTDYQISVEKNPTECAGLYNGGVSGVMPFVGLEISQ